ncbi:MULTISPECIES: hypothetical protein [unclassified Stenotrophomonas]|uniref:HNH endonuclease n=1 Tax=unclassified Stenotrophomonas TaxID=196198 RepID=UPI002449FBC3|nr:MULTISPECIES: hypothetical protein [unclassified Stenotrophomonas]MDG9845157.1 hypothetical protein [Stenotrophomonas sp. GD04054]MDH0017301.1 hypothetical protein [Stenotrophomonas sp. GD04028]MDH0577068.1 hypothetical protein [Stenotrophomonas sp. GD03997]MDH0860416.1 hypothetical protein [Stenotrophomonas sp. GD03882]
MRTLPLPNDRFDDVYGLYTGATVDEDLKARLLAIRPALLNTAALYAQKATLAELHNINRLDAVGNVTKAELKALYQTHVSATKGAARDVYNRIRSSSPNNKCPLCGVGTVAQCDHHLPQSKYPDLTVLPLNLVPICHFCNDRKKAKYPRSAGQQTFHPYYDEHLLAENWVWAELKQGGAGVPPVLAFEARPPGTWPQDDQKRVKHHFKACGLAVTFATNANDELSSIRKALDLHSQSGGQQAVQEYLHFNENVHVTRINSWQYAMYRALAGDAWFVGGGYQHIP